MCTGAQRASGFLVSTSSVASAHPLSLLVALPILPALGFGGAAPPSRVSHRLRARSSCPCEDPLARRSLPLAADSLSRPKPRQGALPAACTQSGASPAALWQPRERPFPGPNGVRPAFQERQAPPTFSEKMTFETALM